MLKVKNWSSYQHYKHRNPPWIKLSTSIFQDYDFFAMSDASKLLAICILTLASRYKDPQAGIVPDNLDWIKSQCGLGKSVTEENLQELENKGFIERASKMLASCKQSAMPETETEPYSKETEERQKVHTAIQKFNELAKRIGLPVAQKITKPRKTKMALRLKEIGGLEGWDTVLQKIENSDFLRGVNKSGWVADLDFVLQEASIVKIMEGKYEGNKRLKTKNVTEQLEEILKNGW